MELRQLKYFVTLSEELNFSRAAEKCFVSQPVLSRAIQSLEDELGVSLFNRTRNSCALTEAGKALLDHAKPIIGHTAAIKGMFGKGWEKQVRLRLIYDDYLPTMGNFDPILHRFQQRYPDVDLELIDYTNAVSQHQALIQQQRSDVSLLVSSQKQWRTRI